MKKIFLIGLILAVAVVASGCAAAKPKIYVPESELPKTKFVVVEVVTHKEFKVEKDEWIFSNPIDEEEYSKIFKEEFKKNLEEKGFVVFSNVDIKKDISDFLLIKISLSNKPPLVPILTNGTLAYTAIVEKNGRIVWRIDGAYLTDPPIVPPSWHVRVKLAPNLAKVLAETFLK